jgi:putative ABC transport system permease protein
MIKNHLKIALRTMRQQKLYSGLNILGLALGIGCFLLIVLFVQYEHSYDRFHPDYDRVHRIFERQPNNWFMGNDRFAVTPAPLARTLEAEFPQVAHATSIGITFSLIGDGESHFYEHGIWADSNFFQVFPFPLLQGNPNQVLHSPESIVLTASLARRVFGDQNPIGRSVTVESWEGEKPFTVAGVVADVPSNAHFTFQYILPLLASSNYLGNLTQWTTNSWHTYFRLADGGETEAMAAAIQAAMPDFVLRHVGSEQAENYEYHVQPLTDIHLRSGVNFDLGPAGDIQYVYLFGAIGLVILLLACINYMNLAIARSIKRAREVGLRQAIGAQRVQVMGQFMSESVLMASLALALGIVFAGLAAPVFGHLVNRPITLGWDQHWLYPVLAGLVLVVGVVSGSYPALYMSRLRPIQTLKGVVQGGPDRSRLQRFLIVAQFTASIALVAGSLVIYRQLEYILGKEVGYTRDRIVTFPILGSADSQDSQLLIERVKRVPGVLEASVSSYLPTDVGSSNIVSSWEGREGEREMAVYQMEVSVEFLSVFEIPLVAGQGFLDYPQSDSIESVILNETTIKALGWTPEESIGRQFLENGRVVGVVRDFHLHSLHLPIAPMMLRQVDTWYSYLAVRLSPADMPATVAALTALLDEGTDYPVEYTYLEDVFAKQYLVEQRLGQTIGYFTLLAMLIAALGLFGLAAYASERRSKEIGIRKVLGASVADLVSLLSREFLGLVLVALVVAVPLGYFGVRRWLDGFAYRVDLGMDVFLIAGVLAVFVALAAVSYQALRTALADPVDSLRYE